MQGGFSPSFFKNSVCVTISSSFVTSQETLAQITLSDTIHVSTLSDTLRVSVRNHTVHNYQHKVALLTHAIPQSHTSYTYHPIHIILHVSTLSHNSHVLSTGYISHVSAWIESYTCRPYVTAYTCKLKWRLARVSPSSRLSRVSS